MTRASATSSRRKRGEIETLPSGSLRVRVYAGVDALTGKRCFPRPVGTSAPLIAGEIQ